MNSRVVRIHVFMQIVQTSDGARSAIGRGHLPTSEADFGLVDEDDGSGVRIRSAVLSEVLLADLSAVARLAMVPAPMVVAASAVVRLVICAGGRETRSRGQGGFGRYLLDLSGIGEGFETRRVTVSATVSVFQVYVLLVVVHT